MMRCHGSVAPAMLMLGSSWHLISSRWRTLAVFMTWRPAQGCSSVRKRCNCIIKELISLARQRSLQRSVGSLMHGSGNMQLDKQESWCNLWDFDQEMDIWINLNFHIFFQAQWRPNALRKFFSTINITLKFYWRNKSDFKMVSKQFKFNSECAFIYKIS